MFPNEALRLGTGCGACGAQAPIPRKTACMIYAQNVGFNEYMLIFF